MKTIGIICACDTELKPFLPYLEQVRVSETAMHRFYCGFLFGHPVVCVQCGVCKVNAALTAQILIDRYHTELMINSGTAGGMDPQVNIFDTVISERIAHHDVAEGILTRGIPHMETEFFYADDNLLEAAKRVAQHMEFDEENEVFTWGRAGSESSEASLVSDSSAGTVSNLEAYCTKRVHFGTVVSGESFIDDEGRTEINRRFSPLAVDMETAGIAHACYINDVPFLSVRTITDTEAERGLSVYSINSGKAEEIAAQFTMASIKALSYAKNA